MKTLIKSCTKPYFKYAELKPAAPDEHEIMLMFAGAVCVLFSLISGVKQAFCVVYDLGDNLCVPHLHSLIALLSPHQNQPVSPVLRAVITCLLLGDTCNSG